MLILSFMNSFSNKKNNKNDRATTRTKKQEEHEKQTGEQQQQQDKQNKNNSSNCLSVDEQMKTLTALLVFASHIIANSTTDGGLNELKND